MIALAAANLGYRCHVYAPEADPIAADVCAAFTQGAFDDEAALSALPNSAPSSRTSSRTWLRATGRDCPPRPPAPARPARASGAGPRERKDFRRGAGRQARPVGASRFAGDLKAAVATIGAPGILKTRRDGYDGKGQWRIMTPADADTLDLAEVPLIYEGFVTFAAEFSVILVRTSAGEVRFWDSAENVHKNGILDRSTVPASQVILDQVDEARAMAAKVADALDYVGVLTLEFFATADGPVFNEMAPRVHNSGHWSIEGCADQPVRKPCPRNLRAALGINPNWRPRAW